MAEPTGPQSTPTSQTAGTSELKGPRPQAEPRSFIPGVDAAPTETASAFKDASEEALAAAGAVGEVGRKGAETAVDSWKAFTEPFFASRVDFAKWMEAFWRQSAALSPLGLMGASGPGLGLSSVPPVDLAEGEGAYALTAEVAGVDPQNLTVKIVGDALVLSGEKRSDRSGGEGALRFQERRYGRFERRIEIPKDVDRAGISAEYAAGVLHVNLPRLAGGEASERRIEVRRSSLA